MHAPALPFSFHPALVADNAAQVLAYVASFVLPVAGAGIRWESTGPAFLDAWREPGAWTLRLGRLELVIDLT